MSWISRSSFFPLGRSIALRAAWLFHHPACPPLAHAMPLTRIADPHSVVAPGLEASRGDVLQHRLLQAQLIHQSVQLGVFLLQLLQPPRLIYLHPAIFLAPTIVRPLHDTGFLARLGRHLSVGYRHFHLPQQVHDFFRFLDLPCHFLCPFVQFLSPIHWFNTCRAFQFSSFENEAVAHVFAKPHDIVGAPGIVEEVTVNASG